MSRLWGLLSTVVRGRRATHMERAVSQQDLSAEERAVIDPYREYILEAAPPWPRLSMAAGVALGAFGALTMLGVIVTKGWAFKLIALPPLGISLYLAWVSRTVLYERKKKQRALYETLRTNPRRLLDDEYRARFDELVDVDPEPSDASTDTAE